MTHSLLLRMTAGCAPALVCAQGATAGDPATEKLAAAYGADGAAKIVGRAERRMTAERG